MDYHLDWLYAALEVDDLGDGAVFPSPGFLPEEAGGDPMNINTNQEDVDLLLAFERDGVDHLVVLEAKADTGWTNKQLRSKARRLRTIFGNHGQRHRTVKLDFVVCSPKRPIHLSAESWPDWMAPSGSIPWVELPVPDSWRRIERFDPSSGLASAAGAHRRVKPTKPTKAT